MNQQTPQKMSLKLKMIRKLLMLFSMTMTKKREKLNKKRMNKILQLFLIKKKKQMKLMKRVENKLKMSRTHLQ